MLIFLDTEFTDFPESECDLISIGLVDENDREFYAELTDYRQEACSGFVREVVLPSLGQHKNRITGTRYMIAKELAEWLELYRETECTICFDYNTDWQLMRNMIMLLPNDMLPDFLTTKNIWGDIDQQALDWFWLERDTIGWKPHMALYDAHANKFAYKPLVKARHETQR